MGWTTVYSTTFDGTESPLSESGSWTQGFCHWSADKQLQKSSGTANPSLATTNNYASSVLDGISAPGDDQQVTMTIGVAASSWVTIGVRGAGTGTADWTGYNAFQQQNHASSALFKVVSGSGTQIGSAFTPATWYADQKLRFNVIGSTLYLERWDGAWQFVKTETDATIGSGGSGWLGLQYVAGPTTATAFLLEDDYVPTTAPVMFMHYAFSRR